MCSVKSVIGTCAGAVSIGAGLVGSVFLARAADVSKVYAQCCVDSNQSNSNYLCPGGGLSERGDFCKQLNHTSDFSLKIGIILIVSCAALACVAGICFKLSPSPKRTYEPIQP